ncbi:hypothetical protein QEZ52_07815 [Aliisedimentitalea scapharcae]|uniref:Uncharacterized protein n=1 Tax=Aliisedimentitalea scapharcae TaxID=1524259 RepID=A0ABZ2XWG1_9RHOB
MAVSEDGLLRAASEAAQIWMPGAGALADLRAQITGQSRQVLDRMIDQLHEQSVKMLTPAVLRARTQPRHLIAWQSHNGGTPGRAGGTGPVC